MTDIYIEEMPSGCIVHCNDQHITISSYEDAEALIESLHRMIQWMRDHEVQDSK